MNSEDDFQRSVLPIPDEQHVGVTTYDAKDKDTKFPPIRQLRPPKGAPNVLVILIDDCGFGATSTFGGPVATPTRTDSPRAGSSSIDSIRPRCARPRARRCSPGAITTR